MNICPIRWIVDSVLVAPSWHISALRIDLIFLIPRCGDSDRGLYLFSDIWGSKVADYKWTDKMTIDEKWRAHYDEVVEFIETHHRNPSRYDPEERGRYVNWIKHNRKRLNAGEMKETRATEFRQLLSLMEQHKRKNQYSD